MKTMDIEFNLQYYMWVSDMLTIFELIRKNKHSEFTKDEIIEFSLAKNSLIAHFKTISNEVAKEFAEYLKDLGFNCGDYKNDVIVDFDYKKGDGKYISDDIYKEIMNSIKDILNVYPY